MFSLASSWLRRVFFLIPAVGLCVLSASCDGFFVSESSIQSESISPPGALLQAGATPPDTITFTASATTVGGSNKSPDPNATFSSSDTTVATVDPNSGVATATASTGCQAATIKASDSGKSATATVITYTGAIPSTFTVSPPNGITTTVAPGTTFKPVATANLPCNANQSITSLVTWSLSGTGNTAGATIDRNGNVSVPSTAGATTTFTVNGVVQLGKAAGATTQATGSLTFTVS